MLRGEVMGSIKYLIPFFRPCLHPSHLFLVLDHNTLPDDGMGIIKILFMAMFACEPRYLVDNALVNRTSEHYFL
jgi:hypothetical protein